MYTQPMHPSRFIPVLVLFAALPAHIAAATDEESRVLESRKILAKNPDSPEAWQDLLLGLHRLGRRHEAAVAAEEAAKRCPQHAEVLGLCVRANRAAGRLAAARQLAAASPEDGESIIMLSERLFLSHARGQTQETHRLFDRLEKRLRGTSPAADELLNSYRATFCGTDAQPQEKHGPHVKDDGECPLKTLADGRWIAAAKINDRETVPLLLDSGTLAHLSLSHEAAAAAGLTAASKTQVLSPTTSQMCPTSLARTVTLGSLRLADVPAVIQDKTQNPAVQGALGPAIFGNSAVTFDLARGRLIVTRKPPEAASGHPRTAADVWLVADKILVSVEIIGDGEIAAVVDTGASRSVCSEAFAKRLAQTHPTTTRPTAWLDSAGKRTAESLVVKNVDARFAHCRLTFAGLPATAFLDNELSREVGVDVSLVLGADVLGSFDAFTIDYANRRMSVTPRGASKPAKKVPTSAPASETD